MDCRAAVRRKRIELAVLVPLSATAIYLAVALLDKRMWQLENSLNGYVDLTNRLFDTVEQSQANAEDYKRLWKAEAYSFEVAAAEASVMIDQLQSQIADPQNLIETAHTCLNPGAARKVAHVPPAPDTSQLPRLVAFLVPLLLVLLTSWFLKEWLWRVSRSAHGNKADVQTSDSHSALPVLLEPDNFDMELLAMHDARRIWPE